MFLIDPKFNMALVQMTNRCNITCRHCYVSSHPHGAFGLPRERLFTLVDELEQLGIDRLALSGGEPLSRVEDCLDTLDHARGRLTLLLLTNAMLITDRVAKRLVDLDPVIRVSLDGASAETHDRMRGPGSFIRTLRGIERLLAAGFNPERLEFFSTLITDTVDEMHRILALAEGFGITHMKVEPVSRTGRAVDTWGAMTGTQDDPDTRLYRQNFNVTEIEGPEHTWRVADIADTAFRVLTIYENGETYPYTWTDERDREVGYLGNINDEPLRDALQPERVSKALLAKVYMMSQVPKRSLRALRLIRDVAPDLSLVTKAS